jgi:two-component system cell cycle sensor histidine kinase/response regulator CckA
MLLPEPNPEATSETVLLVEDEAMLRALVGSILRRNGHRVLEAASGQEALELWNTHSSSIHLVLTDMVLPEGFTGRELAEKLLAEKPTLKIIFTSGYSLETVGEGLKLETGVNFLQKPFDPKLLLGIVRKCLLAP